MNKLISYQKLIEILIKKYPDYKPEIKDFITNSLEDGFNKIYGNSRKRFIILDSSNIFVKEYEPVIKQFDNFMKGYEN